MRRSLRVSSVIVGACLLLAPGLALAQGYSHARIVRLSFIQGTVTVQRPDVPEWAAAPVNTPIQEGFKLATAENSFAEVEFENTSTARLGQLSRLEFLQLALSPSGGKINRLALDEGYATFQVAPGSDDINEVKAPNATVTPYGKTMFRVDLDGGTMRVEVFKGSVEVSSMFGTEDVAKGNVLVMRPGAAQPLEVSRGITKDEWDEWVEKRENVQAKLDRRPVPGVYTNNVSSLLYGWDDLWNYGQWASLPGYGYGWFPHASAGWSPYTFGRWCWYPTFGYTWISGEPWGWLPYHYGQWTFIPGAGWCWLPGNFNVWQPAQVVWLRGPGWVGWAPRVSVVNGQIVCPAGQWGCTVGMSLEAFQNGKVVTPSSMLRVDPSQARPTTNPDVSPARSAMLPGPPHHPVVGFSAISYDPTSKTFVNKPTTGVITVVTTPTATSAVNNTTVVAGAEPAAVTSVNSGAQFRGQAVNQAPQAGSTQGPAVGAGIFTHVSKGPGMFTAPHSAAPSNPGNGPGPAMHTLQGNFASPRFGGSNQAGGGMHSAPSAFGHASSSGGQAGLSSHSSMGGGVSAGGGGGASGGGGHAVATGSGSSSSTRR